ncbi:YetF domain-containing protein [Mycobacterium persicum]|uniref:YetF domain-containing protein n=1 Tax=Mycobacterium persicum TaxID=1487726 RepID=UPI000A70B93C|nr:YetF domain-containing protein [Mycobacterium persicum]
MRFILWVRRLVDPPVRVLIRCGHVDQRNLRRCRLTRDDLDPILREHGHDTTDVIQLALFETKGVVSILTDDHCSHGPA